MNGEIFEKYSLSKKGEGKIMCRVLEMLIVIIRRLMEENIFFFMNIVNMRVFEYSVSVVRMGIRYI